MTGKIYPPNTLFLRESVGDATCDQDGQKYELSINVGGSCPIIRNKRTGLWFTLTWNEILTLAKKAGIDKRRWK